MYRAWDLGARIRRTLGDVDPLNKLPFKRAMSGVLPNTT